MPIWRLRRNSKLGSSRCYETENPADYLHAVSAFLIDEGIKVPEWLELSRWDGKEWELSMANLAAAAPPPPGAVEARRVKCPK